MDTLNMIHGTESYRGHHWAYQPSECKICRAAYRQNKVEFEKRQGWRVRPVKGGGFKIQRLLWTIGHTHQRWVNLDGWGEERDLKFVASADASCWYQRNVLGTLR